MTPLATQVERAGFASGKPVAVARCDRSGVVEEFVTGGWPNGGRVTPTDRFCVASLAKQVTGAALALLVRDGRVDPDLPVATYLDGLPPWSARVTPRHLAHHVAGLPPAGEVEARISGDWTEALAFSVLAELSRLLTSPGTAYAYSNLGYVLLARIIAEVSGMPLAQFAATRLFAPLEIEGIGFLSDPATQPQLPLLGPSLSLTHGDGGLWSTAPAFARWLHHQNLDTLGIASLVTAPGHLNDGTSIDYGWGLGLRQHRGQPLHIHGGEWTGAVAKAVRSPVHGLAVVAMAAGNEFELLNPLVAAAFDDLLP
jgi:CubicO group peptidase (beta-lactamase class C family)